jgi:tetratricopeptide (TPR) repeat protein
MGKLTRPMLQHMERTASTQPTSATLMELAGRLYSEHGWHEDAMRCFRSALQMDPKRRSAAVQLAALETRKGDTDAATSSAAKASASSALLLSAVQADGARNESAAVREYEEALKNGDTTGVAANNLAWIYARQGTNLDRALELAQRAREANPIDPAVTDTLGYVLLKRRQYSMAVAALKRADDLLKAQKSNDADLAAAIHAHLAEAYRSSGEKATD